MFYSCMFSDQDEQLRARPGDPINIIGIEGGMPFTPKDWLGRMGEIKNFISLLHLQELDHQKANIIVSFFTFYALCKIRHGIAFQ